MTMWTTRARRRACVKSIDRIGMVQDFLKSTVFGVGMWMVQAHHFAGQCGRWVLTGASLAGSVIGHGWRKRAVMDGDSDEADQSGRSNGERTPEVVKGMAT